MFAWIYLFCFSLIFVLVSCNSEHVLVRGVSDSNLQRYVGVNGQFTCFDNLKTIPIKWVNDDYCDCFDGSDEPGTSACFNSVFYCRNRGYQQKYVYGVFVDDGVCDCCDGSDESSGSCNNTCVDKGKQELEQLFREVEGYAKGLELKDQMIRNGLGKKTEWENELQEMEKFINQKRPILEQLKEKRDNLQAEEDERQRIIREQEELEKKKREEEEAARKQEEETAASQQGEAAPTPEQQSEQENTVSNGEQQPQEHENKPSKIKLKLDALKNMQKKEGEGEDQKEEQEQELSEEELGKKIASQWTHDPEAVGDNMDLSEEEMLFDDDHYDYDLYHQQADQQSEDQGEEVVEEKPGILGRMMKSAKNLMSQWGSSSSEKDTAVKPTDSKTPPQDPHPELTAAKSEFDTVDTEVKSAENRVKDLEAKLVMDFGSENEFMSLADECFEVKVDKYVYKMCPFNSASQDHTSLGSFRGFEENYSRMVFDKGATCWSGPARSLKVKLTCGVENELTQIEEPSRCEYTALFFTPLACTKPQAEDVTNRYRQLEAELKEVEQSLKLKHDEL